MFKYRLISFPLLLLLAFIVVCWQPYGRWLFMALAIPVTAAAVWESCTLAGKLNLTTHRILALILAMLILAGYGFGTTLPEQTEALPDITTLMILWFAVSMVMILFVGEEKRGKLAVAALATPGVLIFALLPVVTLTRIYLDYGAMVFLSLVLVTKASDTGGYIVGMISHKLMKNGNHKIVPSISPKKSWEGTVGAAVFSITTAWLSVRFECIELTAAELLIFGFLAFLGSFAGDLTESQLKRTAQIKDSANWIPGMGGILDVLDSFIYNAPLFYLVLENGVIICQ